MQLPGNARQMLRDAVRNHTRAASVLAGRKVNDLPKADLIAVAELLGINLQAFVAEVQKLDIQYPGLIADAAAARGDAAETNDETAAPAGDVPAETNTPTSLADEATAFRRELGRAMVEGDFDSVTARITQLIQEARKPAEVITNTITETVYVAAPAGTNPAAIQTRPMISAAPLGTETWGRLFNVTGPLASKKINVFAPSPATPRVDARYRWPDQTTQAALCALGRGRNVWLYGPAGTGKSSFAEQLAARTGRPFVLIPCDDTTEAPELVGMTVPHQGGVRWQDGVLTAAMRTPNCVVLIDEPTVARAGAVMVLQSVLASGVLSIKETGETVRCAEGVRFIVADNTNGTGGGSSEGYEGTRRMNRATLDRFASFLRVDYMQPADEAAALVSHTGCTIQLATLLVECAGLTRKARVTHALGLRRLIAWAEALTDGLEMRAAFEAAILNACARDDREPTEQCCALGLDKKRVKTALAGQNSAPAASASPVPLRPDLSRAAADFAA